VVNGKCSLITRMPGDYWRQFAGMRALAFYQMTHAGGKLNFMGNEIAQFIEWRYYEGIQYFLAEQYDTHRHQQQFVAALNAFYNAHPALWQRSYTSDGFEWIDADNAKQSIISFIRRGDNPKDDLVILINFDVNAREDFRLGVPEEGYYEELFNSDAEQFGGSGVVNIGKLETSETPWNGREQSVVVRVPPLGGIILHRTGALRKRRATTTRAKTATTKATAAKKPAAKAKAAAAEKKAPAKPAAKKPAAKKPTASKATTKPAAKTTAEKKPAARRASSTKAPKTK
jgi:1,4-alpha-glucan branching enzyme